MRLSPKIFTATAARIASSFSLLLVLLACSYGGQWSDLQAKLEAASSVNQAKEVFRQNPQCWQRRELEDDVSLFLDAAGKEAEQDLQRLKAIVHGFALSEQIPEIKDASSQAKDIKKSPLYRDAGEKQSSNWLGRALESLRNLKLDLGSPKPMNGPDLSFLQRWIKYFVWTLLIAGVLAFIWYVARHINWKNGLQRKAKALLEEDEPERTLDEWLAQADLLTSQGKYREAVRALYLACLLRFDEAGIARFDRGQTNWEHLERIQASPRYPADLDFRTPTRQFDRIWYGKMVRGIEDVDLFRGWYVTITEKLQAKAA